MKKSEITALVNNLIADNKIKEALDLLAGFVKGIDRYLENELLLQTASFNRNQKDYHSQLISRENYDLSFARTNFSLTQILSRLPENGNNVSISIEVGPDPHPNEKQIILFLTANPTNTGTLRLDEELRKVKDQLAQTTSRDSFKLESETAVKIATITMAMQQYKPTIVHFSGHGTGQDGIVIEGENGKAVLFPTEGLNRLFKLFKNQVKCVLLNACYSKVQAQEISKLGIYVIGMDKAIGDRAAIDFAVGFYQSLGEGNPYEFAFEIAMVNISPNLNDANTPEIWLNGNKI